MRLSYKKTRGFTLIEMLVVLSIISLLASIVLAALNVSRAKALDARRASDMHQIVLALDLFYSVNECLPKTSGSICPGSTGYSEPNSGGWDYSSQGAGFMQFLKNGNFMPSDPLDPVNNMTGDGTPSGTYAYRYYCYSQAGKYGPSLSYWKGSGGWANVAVLTQTALATDSNYLCK